MSRPPGESASGNPLPLLLAFAALAGKYIVLTRPSTPDEIEAGAPANYSAAGTLSFVEDTPAGICLALDWGQAFWFSPGDYEAGGWRLKVYADEAAATLYRET